jgi:hypothetical protein
MTASSLKFWYHVKESICKFVWTAGEGEAFSSVVILAAQGSTLQWQRNHVEGWSGAQTWYEKWDFVTEKMWSEFIPPRIPKE